MSVEKGPCSHVYWSADSQSYYIWIDSKTERIFIPIHDDCLNCPRCGKIITPTTHEMRKR